MNKICTTLEQSKKLMELGIDVYTADMDYVPFVNDSENYDCVVNMWNNEHEEGWIPAWSLSALLDYLCSIDMFPSIENDNNQFELTLSYVEENKERPINAIKTIIIENKELIDACVELIIKLNEKKLL